MIELRKTLENDRLCEFELIVDGQPIGECHVRRRPSHGIGYRIEPEHRGKGFATWMLAAALKEASNMRLASVIICADEKNIASRRVIERNGGQLTAIIPCSDGRCMYRYVVASASMQSAAL